MHGRSQPTSGPRLRRHIRGPGGPWFTSVALLRWSVPHRKLRYKTGVPNLIPWHGPRRTATRPVSVCPHAQGRGTRMGPMGPSGTLWDLLTKPVPRRFYSYSWAISMIMGLATRLPFKSFKRQTGERVPRPHALSRGRCPLLTRALYGAPVGFRDRSWKGGPPAPGHHGAPSACNELSVRH